MQRDISRGRREQVASLSDCGEQRPLRREMGPKFPQRGEPLDVPMVVVGPAT